MMYSFFVCSAGAETVITADQGVRGGKRIDLKRTVDEAVSKCPGVRHVFVMSRTGADVPMGKKYISLEKVTRKLRASYSRFGWDFHDNCQL